MNMKSFLAAAEATLALSLSVGVLPRAALTGIVDLLADAVRSLDRPATG